MWRTATRAMISCISTATRTSCSAARATTGSVSTAPTMRWSAAAGDEALDRSERQQQHARRAGGQRHAVRATATATASMAVTDNDSLGVSGNGNSCSAQAGIDDLAATGNNNTLDGGAGNDTLVAAAGHSGDHFVFQFVYGHDIVQGFSTAGNDVVHLESFGLGTFANLQTYMTQVGNDVLHQLRRRPLADPAERPAQYAQRRATSTWPEREPVGRVRPHPSSIYEWITPARAAPRSQSAPARRTRGGRPRPARQRLGGWRPATDWRSRAAAGSCRRPCRSTNRDRD